MSDVHCGVQGGEDLSGSKLIERLEHELVAQTAALDSLLNPGSSRRGRKQADLSFPDNQVCFGDLLTLCQDIR